jgi:exopolysaccharide biosynthesis polyprenyl glycosylphosphotransferase
MLVTPKPKSLFQFLRFRLFCRRDADDTAGPRGTGPQPYRFSRRARLACFMVLLLADLLGVATGLAVLAHHTKVTAAAVGVAVLGWAVITALSTMMGGRNIETSRDLMTLAQIDSGLCVVMLAGATVVTRAAVTGGAGEAMLLSLAAGCIVLTIGRLAVIVHATQWPARWIQHVLLIGTAPAAARQLRTPLVCGARVGYAGAILIGGGSVNLPLLGRIDARTGESLGAAAGGPEHARRLLRRIDRIVLLEEGLGQEEKSGALTWLERFSHEVHVLPQAGLDAMAAGLGDGYAVLGKRAAMAPFALWVKRTLDIVLSLAALIVLLPGLLIVAALIRLESEGPALFRQQRLGCDNLPFTVFKFRTMRQNHAADGSVQAVRGDARVTKLGAVLRRTSIDEVPQLLNVLNGSMSLVGPRPHPLALNCRFEPFIENYAVRHSVLPGITGWAQINGARGETPTVEAMRRRVELDLEYVRQRSALMDVWILVRTVGSVVRARDVY